MCHIPSLRLVWLYFLFYFYFWRKEIQVYYFWMRLIAKDDIPTPPLSWVGYCCTCCYLDGFFLTCYLVVAVGRNGGESSSSWNKKRIRPSAPSWVQLRGAACPRAHPESFGVHFYFYFYFIFFLPFAATLRVVSLSRVPTGEISKEPRTQPIDFLLLGWMEGERLLSSLFHSFSSSRHRYSVNTKQTTTTFSTKSRAPEHDFHPLPTVTPMIDRQIPSIILANR
jgi:hypothetical protein